MNWKAKLALAIGVGLGFSASYESDIFASRNSSGTYSLPGLDSISLGKAN